MASLWYESSVWGGMYSMAHGIAHGMVYVAHGMAYSMADSMILQHRLYPWPIADGL